MFGISCLTTADSENVVNDTHRLDDDHPSSGLGAWEMGISFEHFDLETMKHDAQRVQDQEAADRSAAKFQNASCHPQTPSVS